MSLDQWPEHVHREIVDKFVDPAVSYQMTTRDFIVRPSAAAPITITLPPVGESAGRIFTIMPRLASPTNTITIASKGDSEGWKGNVVINTAGTKLLFFSDGAAWFQLSDSFVSGEFIAGAPVSGKATAVEQFDGLTHVTILTLTLTGANDLDLANADGGIGAKVYDFPEGRIQILGSIIDATVVVNNVFEASVNDVFIVGAGTVTAAADATLATTEVDLLPAVTLDTVSNTVLSLAWESALAEEPQFDGTVTPVDAFINVAVAGTSISAALTVAITGTWTITWQNLGDIA